MTFAPAEFDVIQELSGFRLSLFLAVRHEEFLDGVCKLSPTQLSQKYKQLSNESNCARIRKQMIKEGWLIEVVGGIVTKKFNTTAKIAVQETDAAIFAVNEESELQKLQLAAKIAVQDAPETAKIAVVEPEIAAESTAKIAGTEIAKKDLELKSININSQDSKESFESENARAHASAPEDFSFLESLSLLDIHGYFFPDYKLLATDKLKIKNRITDKRAWIKALDFWSGNNYRAASVKKQCDRHDEILKEENDERIQPKRNGHQHQTNSDTRTQRAIDEHLKLEQLREHQRRRQEELRNRNAADR